MRPAEGFQLCQCSRSLDARGPLARVWGFLGVAQVRVGGSMVAEPGGGGGGAFSGGGEGERLLAGGILDPFPWAAGPCLGVVLLLRN